MLLVKNYMGVKDKIKLSLAGCQAKTELLSDVRSHMKCYQWKMKIICFLIVGSGRKLYTAFAKLATYEHHRFLRRFRPQLHTNIPRISVIFDVLLLVARHYLFPD